ncbi:NHLP-related RiPP peptide [Streptomyces sp. DSM 116496]|uniref:NHLP-related RiPP peptide n=1 Tax=Streptomyces stoeckheimensis TaxID=3344656 RepID=UPI0038B2D950
MLSTNDRFRPLFTHNRHAALVQAGCKLSDEQQRATRPFSCLSVDKLASRSDIAAAREALKAHLTSSASHTNPHALEGGAMHAVLRQN